MNNLRFLKQIMVSDYNFWVAEAQYSEFSVGRSIWLLAIPTIYLGNIEGNLLLKDVESLRETELQNISLSEPYCPFQNGITLSNFYRGFPVNVDVKMFLAKALNLASKNLNDYEALLNPAGGTTGSINMQHDPKEQQEPSQEAQEAAEEATTDTGTSEAGEAAPEGESEGE